MPVMKIIAATLVLALALLQGCATPNKQQDDGDRTFSEVLRECRQHEPNRHGQKFRLPSTHPHIAECLKRNGWHTDGTRLDSGTGGES